MLSIIVLTHDAVSEKQWVSRSPGKYAVISEDFIGQGALPATVTAGGTEFVSHSGDAGTDAHVFSGVNGGTYKLLTSGHATVKEVAVLLPTAVIDVSKNPIFEARVAITKGTPHAGDVFIIGLANARNDTTDSITHHAVFKMTGANNDILVETDDNTTDTDDKDTGSDWVSGTYYRFKIDMSDLSSVQFFIDDVNATTTTMDMSAAGSTLLLPIVEVQAAASQVSQADVDYIQVVWER